MSASTSLTEAVKGAATRAVVQQAPSWGLASVTAVHSGGKVDITTASGPASNIRRCKSYASPALGDVVVILRNPNGNWVVLDALATS